MKTSKTVFKKVVLILTCFFLVITTSFAKSKSKNDDSEDDKPKKEKRGFFGDRYFEIGVMADLDLSNNYLGIKDILKDTIVLDFNNVPANVKQSGLNINALLDADLFFNINANKWSFGIYTSFDLNAHGNITKDTINLLANGNQINSDMDLGMGFGMSSFFNVDIPLILKLKKLELTVQPTMFMPVIYVPFVDVTVKLRTDSNGDITMAAATDVLGYSVLKVNDSKIDLMGTLSPDLVRKVGLDLTLAAKYPLFKFLDIGVSATSIPIIPVKLNTAYKLSFGVDGKISSDTLKGLSDGSVSMQDMFSYSFDNVGWLECSEKVIRPMKFGAWVDWKVFGNDVLVLTPFVQMKFKDPTVRNNAGFGFDYSLAAKVDWKFIAFGLQTCYIDNVFKQRASLGLNLRLLELDVAVSSQSASFVKSFCGNGLGLGVGVIVGL